MPAARTVRHLRLRGQDADGIRRGALLLEDALRTASLPDAGGRILVVRRLALGAIDPQAPPQRIALALEQAMQRLNRGWVHGGDSEAATAAAVWFGDALEAHTLLALRLAGGGPVDAWYWPLAVPAWRRRDAPATALRALALSLAALPEAAAALPAWTAALAGAGHGDRLAAAIHDEDVVALARAAGLVPPLRPVAASVPADSAAAGWTRSTLLRALRRAAGHALAAVTDPPRPMEAVLGVAPTGAAPRFAVESGRQRPATAAPGAALSAQAEAAPPRMSATPSGRPAAGPATDRAIGRCPSDGAASAGQVLSRPYSAHAMDMVTHAAAWNGTSPSAAGGLLFLIAALAHTGYPEWLDAQLRWARWDIARRMFAAVLARLAVSAEDQAWRLTGTNVPRGAPPDRFVAPSRWRDGLCAGRGRNRVSWGSSGGSLWDASARLLLGSWRKARPRPLLPLLHDAAVIERAGNHDLPSQVAAAWLTACRRWLRRYAGIGLADLVLRPAGLAVSPTHIDLHFDLGQADLRLRRAGLDLDPGWVPWLGRVVSFHYERREER